MNKLESLTTSFKLSQKLKEAGCPQESVFVWVDKFPIFNEKTRLVTRDELNQRLNNSILSVYSAYLAGELGEMLPETIADDEMKVHFNLDSGSWTVSYTDNVNRHFSQWGKTEAEARGKMLLYLIENGHVDVEDLG